MVEVTITKPVPPQATAPVLLSPRRVETLPTALLVECNCPDWCERDHDRD
jgi:hypothetical protein